MQDQSKPLRELIGELEALRARNSALEKAEADRRRAENALQLQQELMIALGRTSNLQECLELCLSAALQASAMDCGGLYLADERTGGFRLVWHEGLSDAFVAISKTIGPRTPHVRLIQAGRSVYIRHSDLTADGQKLHEGLRALAVVPIVHQGIALACLNLASHTLDETPREIRPLIESLASSIGGFLARAIMAEALRESEEKYRGIFENAVEGFFQSTPEGRFISVNPAFAHIFGYASPEELIADISDIAEQYYVNPEDRRRYMERLAEKGSVEHFEFRARRKDGMRIWVSNSTRAFFDSNGGVIRYEGIVEDITDRKEAEEKLRESEDRYNAFVNAHDDMIFVKDECCRYVLANEATLRFFGKGREELLHNTDFELMDATAAENCKRSDLMALDTGSTVISEERVGDRYFETRKFPLHMKNGMTGIGGIVRDITDVKRTELERQALEDRLRRSEKMEALGTLAGGVAHDLNNVLGVLVGYSELLTEKLPADSPLKKYANSILQSGLRGAAIVQDLLDLARRGVAVSEVVSLNRVVSHYLRTPEYEKLRSLHPGVFIRTELEDGLLNIQGSPVHLGKTIMNLLTNAAEAIQDTGEVVIRTENRHLDRFVRGYDEMKPGDYVVLTISDSGSGISSEDLGRIFEPFYTKKVMGRSGTGLGLSVVWGTVQDHGGYVDVQSEEGRGSMFSLYFPVTRHDLTAAEKPKPPVSYAGLGESILVVDDVQEQRELAATILGGLGYRVEAVAGGEEAVSYLRTRQADLILLDMIMEPGMDGLETYRKILEIHPEQKAIVVSGFSETDRVKKAQELGAGDYVRKPYILERIGLAVRKELDRDRSAGTPEAGV